MIIKDILNLFISILLDFANYDFLLCCLGVIIFVYITALINAVIFMKGGK